MVLAPVRATTVARSDTGACFTTRAENPLRSVLDGKMGLGVLQPATRRLGTDVRRDDLRAASTVGELLDA